MQAEIEHWKQTAAALRLQLQFKEHRYRQLHAVVLEERAAKIAMQQEVLLVEAQRAATSRRWRIIVGMASVGLVFLAVGVPLLYQHLYGLLPASEIVFGIPGAVCIFGFLFAAMAALPTDDALHRILAAIGSMTQMVNTVGFGTYAALHFTGVYSPEYDSLAAREIIAWVVLFYAVVSLASAPFFLSLLRLGGVTKPAPLSQVKSFAVSNAGPVLGTALLLLLFPVVWAAAQPATCFRHSTHATHVRLWINFRALVAAWGISNLVAVLACAHHKVHWHLHPVVPSLLFLSCVQLIIASIGASTPVRRSAHAWLGRIGTTVEVQAAAGVAALVGALRPAKALVLAKKRFCGLPFECLQLTDLTTNTDTGLYQKSVLLQLGQCDAFISHSWSDPGGPKFAVLKLWAKQFENRCGRHPYMWLDKACIQQGPTISEQLACLPIFLSGCKELLVLAGSTFTQRLWCVVELFTFLKMGGDTARLTVVPIQDGDLVGRDRLSRAGLTYKDLKGAATETSAVVSIREQFHYFDASKAKCFKPEERERLLSVIESGFGTLSAFNELVAGLFDQSEERRSSLDVSTKTRRIARSLTRSLTRRRGSFMSTTSVTLDIGP